ncbi:dienelactone hydrolase family protein [Streptomycetaceae bacterium NBC_01309]
MTHSDVTVPTGDGEAGATLHAPPGAGRAPGVLMFTDAAGVRQTFVAMADRLAAAGYWVLVPDYYHRTPFEPFDPATVFADPDERARLSRLASGLTTPMIVRDTGAYLRFLAAVPMVSGDGLGTTGYCMGGRFSLLAAVHHPDLVAAAASFHGGNLAAADDPDSPALTADRIRAGVYVAAAENDASFPADQYARLAGAFAAAGVRATLETYPAAHGFAVPDNTTHDAAAEERHWLALLKLYGDHLTG